MSWCWTKKIIEGAFIGLSIFGMGSALGVLGLVAWGAVDSRMHPPPRVISISIFKAGDHVPTWLMRSQPADALRFAEPTKIERMSDGSMRMDYGRINIPSKVVVRGEGESA